MPKRKENNIDMLVKLDVYDRNGNIIERWKTLVSNQKIGKRILLRVKALFGLKNSDIISEEQRLMEEDLKIQREFSSKV